MRRAYMKPFVVTRAAVIDADGYGFKIPAPVFGFVVLNNDAVAGECVALI